MEVNDHPDRPVRERREPPSWSPAGVYADDLGPRRRYLDRLRVHHLDLTRRFVEVDDGNMYWTDLLVVTVTSRSYSLVDGFTSAFDTWNPIVAAPIVRMQLDNLIRLAYAAHNKTEELAKYVVMGGEFRRLRDAEGRKLTDRRLVEHARESHPWVEAVYEATSGWVHLSPQLLHAVVDFGVGDEDTGIRAGFGVPIRRERIPLSALQELIGAMTQATEEVFGYIEGWESRKGHPLGERRDLGVS